ncbi:MAG: Tfp pilus assembly protein PilF, partial [Myxococcota bacterium]
APAGGEAPFIEGRVSALLALGRHDTALSEASAAYRTTGEEVYLLQAREAERQLQLQRVTELIESDRLQLAETSLRRRLEVAPEDTQARTVLAALLLATERPEAAFDQAATALRFEPGNADALTVLRRAGDVLDRADEVLPYYSNTSAGWAQQEASFLALDAALTAAVRDPEPEVAIATVAEQQAGASARKWVMVGGAWLEVGEPARAQGAFEVALSLDPHSADAARGLAGALQSRGEGERAADVLRLMWHSEKDPLIGQQLHALLLDLGRPFEARLVHGELLRAADDAARAPASSSVSSLPVIAAPSGVRAESAEPAPTPLETVMALQPKAEAEPTPLGTLEVGVLPGQIRRPGTAGEQQLTAQFVTIGAEWTPPLPLWVGAAVVPMRISDGETTGDGIIPGGWIGIGGGRLALEASAASTPLQLDAEPRLTGKLALTGRPVSEVSLSLIGAQMAATDTTTSWFGKDGVGRAMDRWLGSELVWGGPVEFGLIGRFGETTALNIDNLPWQQGQAWVRGDFVAEPEGSIAGHIEGMVLQHDLQVGGFTTGEAAMFSPEGYYSLLGRVELERNLDRWGACAHGALGPQVITGEDSLYLNTGTWLGYRIEGGVFAQLTDNLEAKVGYRLEGTWGQWYQELAILQLSTRSHGTTAASDRVAMRLPAGSPVHGIPITALGACGGVQ